MENHPEEKKKKVLKEMSLVEFSLFLMALVLLILGVIYFVYFTEVQSTLKPLEVRQTSLIVK